MDISLAMQVGNLVSQGNAILQGLRNELGQLETPAVTVTKDFIAEGAGQLVSEIFKTKKARRYGKKFTKRILAGNIQANRQAILARYDGIVARWESDVVGFLQQVSCPASGLTAPGNSAKLVGRVRQADRYKKLETRVQHITIELQAMSKEGFVYNSSLPQALPKPIEPTPDSAKLLKDLEVTLRGFIERELSKVSSGWLQRVPPDIRNRVESRKSRSETTWPWYPPTSTNVVDYLDFSDYRKIILDPNNWQQVFSKFFKIQSFIEVRLGELEPIRNDAAHSRKPSKLAADKLRIYCAELKECMKT